jgi:hypothetical protein
MGMVIIRVKVKDYAKWRPVFDGHVAKQKAAGSPIRASCGRLTTRTRSSSSYEMDMKKAKEFGASADLKEAMMRSGVIDQPTVYFLEPI